MSEKAPRRFQLRRWPFITALLLVFLIPLGLRYAPYSFDIEDSGRTGLTVNKAGEPILLVHACSVSVTRIVVLSNRYTPVDKDPAPPVADLSTKVPIFAGITEVNLANPGWRWKGRLKNPVFSGKDGFSIGSSNEDNGFTIGVTPTSEQIENLKPGQVLIGTEGSGTNAVVVNRAEFNRETCAAIDTPPEASSR